MHHIKTAHLHFTHLTTKALEAVTDLTVAATAAPMEAQVQALRIWSNGPPVQVPPRQQVFLPKRHPQAAPMGHFILKILAALVAAVQPLYQ